MIRLIASDLDGTLLDPAGNLPAGTFPVLLEGLGPQLEGEIARLLDSGAK